VTDPENVFRFGKRIHPNGRSARWLDRLISFSHYPGMTRTLGRRLRILLPLLLLFLLTSSSPAYDRNAVLHQPFTGHDRKAPKTSIANKAVQTYTNLVTLLNSLPDEAFMQAKADTGDISRSPTAPRIPQEKRNVRVDCWIIAIKHEDNDNDFHMVLADRSTAMQASYLNAEISGLPDQTSAYYHRLLTARTQFLGLFGAGGPPFDFHAFAAPLPLHVRVQGSLFYDVDHAPGIVGPAGYRPDTSWEIHPVTSIQALTE
jgi:hypothetical protein